MGRTRAVSTVSDKKNGGFSGMASVEIGAGVAINGSGSTHLIE